MKLYNFPGPFHKGDVINIPPSGLDTKYLQIGLQHRYVNPISPNLDPKNSTITTDFKINGKEYKVNIPGYLEFEIDEDFTPQIECLHDMPPETIIDIAYKEN